MRRKRLIWNTVAAVSNQIVLIVCGLILPKAILSAFGSDVNGLVSSIKQFLGVIAFMELGVGAVVQTALYKPLAEANEAEISKIMISATRFFRNIARVFLVYVVALSLAYPFLVDNEFGYFFTSTLVIIIAINSFAEYYFGIVNQQLLIADQKSYSQLLVSSVTQTLNVILCVWFIKLGLSIHVVELTTALIFMIRPIYMSWYVKRNYKINYTIKFTDEPIKQKWNGIAQHLAAVVLDKTDVVVLTTFSTLTNVSIYSVYYLVVNTLKQLVQSSTSGIQSLLGDMIARKEEKKLRETFDALEIFTHMLITFLFTCCLCLIVPFVMVYTLGINDANYNVPCFAILITLANAFYSFRNSYNMIVKAGGYYKETQNSAIIEATINIVISILLVLRFGLVGVAIGTLVSMLYRTLYLVLFLKNNILYRPCVSFFKNIGVDIIEACITVYIVHFIKLDVCGYLDWIMYAIIVAAICGVTCIICNFIVYREKLIYALKKICHK